jgi:hypothetical protein
VAQKVKFKKQYKPIGFGDRPAEVAETRAYNRRMKEFAAQDEAKREGLLSNITNFFTSKPR